MEQLGGRIAWLAPPLLFLIAFFAIPLVYLAGYALGLSDSRGLLVLLSEIAESPYHRQRIFFTYEQAILSTCLTLVLALPVSYLFATRRVPMRAGLQALLIVPFVMPALVVALAFESFLGRNGLASQALGIDALGRLGPLGAILLAHAFYNVGLVTRLVGSFWERVPTELLDSARSLGARRHQAFLRVLLPLGMPAILSAAALVFLFCASSFSLILILGEGRGTIETLIAEEATGFSPSYDLAAALGLLQLLTTLVALALYVGFERRAATWFRTRLEPAREPMPAWGWPFLVAPLALVAGPLLSLVHAALRYGGRYTLDAFRLLADDRYPLGAYGSAAVFINSLRFGLLTVAVAVPLAFSLAAGFRAARARFPLGSSAVLIGLGFLLAFDGTPFSDLRASPLRIGLAHTLVAFPFASRILGPSMASLDPNLRAAARTLGADRLQTLLRIDLPLLRPALAAAAVFAFAASLGEFGATFLLRRPEFTTIPLAIYDSYGRPGEIHRGQAEALSVLLLIVAFLSFLLIERARFRQRRPSP
jgi:thiamine transport system permease protein